MEWIEDEQHRTWLKFNREKQARQNVYIFREERWRVQGLYKNDL
jgi:hypothetical protein